MNKLMTLMLTIIMALALCGCGGSSPEPLSLDGTWKQVGDEAMYHQATIDGDTIMIYWIDDEEKTESLYWAGSVDIPDESYTTETEYVWESVNNKEETDKSILASGDDTKEFAYKDGMITYKASMMGITMQMELEKTE